jgi:hypothetical protein
MATSTVNRIVTSAKRKYVLDNVDGCVFGKSLYLLTNKYKGYCLEVQRLSDSATLNVGFNFALKNPYVDISAIESFCVGTMGRVKTWYDQFGYPNATQSSFNNMPIICTNGVFEVKGIKFVNAESSRFNVESYAAIDFTEPSFSTYQNIEHSSTLSIYVFGKTSTSVNIQYATLGVKSTLYYSCLRLGNATNIFQIEITTGARHKILYCWNNKNVNGTTANINGVSSAATKADTLISREKLVIGARYDGSDTYATHFDGYMTSILLFNTSQTNNYNLISGGC